MRSRARRRSISSLVSPGPRPPMPPVRRDSIVSFSMQARQRYWSCASSTCSLPSRLCARCAKMSRISCVRSMTLRSVDFADRARLRGRESGSKISTRRRAAWRAAGSRRACRARRGTSDRPGPPLHSTSSTLTPAVRHSSFSSSTRAESSGGGTRHRTPCADVDHDQQRAVAPVAPRPGRDALELLLERARRARSGPARCGGRLGWEVAPRLVAAGTGGSRCAAWRSAGRRRGCISMAATRSSRSSARSTSRPA